MEYSRIRQKRREVTVPDIPVVRVFTATLPGMEMLHIWGDEAVREAWNNLSQQAESTAPVLSDGLQPPAR